MLLNCLYSGKFSSFIFFFFLIHQVTILRALHVPLSWCSFHFGPRSGHHRAVIGASINPWWCTTSPWKQCEVQGITQGGNILVGLFFSGRWVCGNAKGMRTHQTKGGRCCPPTPFLLHSAAFLATDCKIRFAVLCRDSLCPTAPSLWTLVCR